MSISVHSVVLIHGNEGGPIARADSYGKAVRSIYHHVVPNKILPITHPVECFGLGHHRDDRIRICPAERRLRDFDI